MLAPNKMKHRKWHKGRSIKRTFENRGTKVSYGEYGLQALDIAWLNGNQIEAARRTVTNYLQREGRLWIRVFPDMPYTAKAAEVGMGKGKGDPKHYVFEVRPGRILFEYDGVPEDIARAHLRQAGMKLPVKTSIVESH